MDLWVLTLLLNSSSTSVCSHHTSTEQSLTPHIQSQNRAVLWSATYVTKLLRWWFELMFLFCHDWGSSMQKIPQLCSPFLMNCDTVASICKNRRVNGSKCALERGRKLLTHYFCRDKWLWALFGVNYIQICSGCCRSVGYYNIITSHHQDRYTNNFSSSTRTIYSETNVANRSYRTMQ